MHKLNIFNWIKPVKVITAFHTQRPGNYSPGNYSICLLEKKFFSYHICFENVTKYSSDRQTWSKVLMIEAIFS